MKNKLTIELVREFVESNSKCELVSDIYLNSKQKLKFKCSCGKIFETSFDTFKNAQQRQCSCCGIEVRASKKRANLNIAKLVFKENGFELLSTEYINARTKLLAKDSEGYKVFITLDNLKSGKNPQRFYQGNIYTIENIKLWLKKNNCNFSIVSNEFISAINKLEFKCLKGHYFETSWNKVQSQNIGCPFCAKSKGEQVIRKYLTDRGFNFEQEKTFDSCKYKKKLRFDFYIKELNVCIEFQGIQHYKPINYFGGESRYNSQVKKDNIKVNFCKENNIKLIRIPYFEIDNIEKILKSAI